MLGQGTVGDLDKGDVNIYLNVAMMIVDSECIIS